jgi:ABC-type transport system involved in multi-copper enzyme maturation permease subunit
MNYLIWRLHRNQVYWAVGALAVLAVLLLITGITMANDYHSFFANCAATQSCGDGGSMLFRGDGAIIDLVNATLIVPLLFGLFWGAPLVSKEYEDGTQNLAWTQGVTRRHWLSTNVLCVFAAAIIWAGVMAALVSWWRFPENALDGRFNAFDIQGLVPVAYAVFAVALGIAVGTMFRRVLPAIATTLGIFVAIRIAIAVYMRPHFMSPLTKLFPLAGGDNAAPVGAWVLSGSLVGPGGKAYGNGISLSVLPPACQTGAFGGKGASLSCMAAHGFHQSLNYQPASRFWVFQGIEAAIFLVLGAALVALAYRMVLKRDA